MCSKSTSDGYLVGICVPSFLLVATFVFGPLSSANEPDPIYQMAAAETVLVFWDHRRFPEVIKLFRSMSRRSF